MVVGDSLPHNCRRLLRYIAGKPRRADLMMMLMGRGRKLMLREQARRRGRGRGWRELKQRHLTCRGVGGGGDTRLRDLLAYR